MFERTTADKPGEILRCGETLASRLSAFPVVREVLTAMQRDLARDGGVVLEGRDTGSGVAPDAEVKFYLDADLAERTRRRAGDHGLARRALYGHQGPLSNAINSA